MWLFAARSVHRLAMKTFVPAKSRCYGLRRSLVMVAKSQMWLYIGFLSQALSVASVTASLGRGVPAGAPACTVHRPVALAAACPLPLAAVGFVCVASLTECRGIQRAPKTAAKPPAGQPQEQLLHPCLWGHIWVITAVRFAGTPWLGLVAPHGWVWWYPAAGFGGTPSLGLLGPSSCSQHCPDLWLILTNESWW